MFYPRTRILDAFASQAVGFTAAEIRRASLKWVAVPCGGDRIPPWFVKLEQLWGIRFPCCLPWQVVLFCALSRVCVTLAPACREWFDTQNMIVFSSRKLTRCTNALPFLSFQINTRSCCRRRRGLAACSEPEKYGEAAHCAHITVPTGVAFKLREHMRWFACVVVFALLRKRAPVIL